MPMPRPGGSLEHPLDEADLHALREAADWFARLQDAGPDSALRRQWESWLHAADAHARAWEWMMLVSGKMAGLKSAAGAPVSTLLRGNKARGRRRALGAGLALLFCGGAAAPMVFRSLPLRVWMATHHAPTGSIERIVLADGSTLWLDTDSAVNVRLGAAARRLELVQGRIFIETAPDRERPARPFEVTSALGVLRPLGTRFCARMDEGGLDVAVFDGAVDCRPSGAETAGRIVPAGSAATLGRGGVASLRPASRAMQAWIDGVLVAEDVPLGAFIRELSRYRKGGVHCHPAAAGYRLVGSFPSGDVDATLAAIARTLPVRIERGGRERIEVVPAG
ncbi:fec operon regulator FecR [Pigmentiphaga humi]|uniref:Fec operon regulator FecR n=1 Tax=Pigmentiphaga humi TaxID=2478468 RepID=A0A3P4B693_9BURK|nr:FecR domain-containing protein [Pigmentiphaga humi]VCU71823.1 fec operon regulator FecR [Pigmentiphaga humi]